MVDWDMEDIDVINMARAIRKNSETQHANIIIMTKQDKAALTKTLTLPDNVILEEKPVSFALIKRLLEKQTG